MFRRIFLAAILAGFAAGLALSVLQAFTTTPMILAAERHEAAPAHEHAAAAWAPADGLERTLYTGVANAAMGVGFALLLAACFALSGRPVDGREGLLWGLAGYAVFSLAPGLGLPPELPGAVAAALEARQLWWLSAAGATALGLWLLAFARAGHWKGLGILALALPHLLGAPQPEVYGGSAPPELAGHFAAASLATMAAFWALLGWLAGWFYARGGRERPELVERPA